MNIGKSILFTVFTIMSFIACGEGQPAEDKAVLDYAKAVGFNIKDNDLKNADPGIFFAYSDTLFKEGKKDDAIFWYYIGQYRARYYLDVELKEAWMDHDVVEKTFKQCNMYEGTVIGDWSHKMAYRMIMDKQGAIINGYAAGNIDNLLSIINKVIAYEDANPCNLNGFARAENMKDQAKWAESKQGVKDGLLELYTYYDENREMIKQKRIEHGLEND